MDKKKSDKLLFFGKFALDAEKSLLFKDGKRVPIQAQALKGLTFLVKNKNRVISREELSKIVWGPVNVVVDQNLNVLIKEIRQVLGDDSKNPIFIETIPRVGYRYIEYSVPGIFEGKIPKIKKFIPFFFLGFVALFLVYKFIEGPNVENPINLQNLTPPIKTMFLNGVNLFNTGNYSQSSELFTEITNLEPNLAEGHFWLGKSILYQESGNFTETNRQKTLFVSAFWEGDFDRERAALAKPYFLKALEFNPEYPEALIEMGKVLLVLELDFQGATRLADQALELSPKNDQALFLLAMIKFGVGDPLEAGRIYHKIHLDSPSGALGVVREGWAYFMAGDFLNAARVCRISLKAEVNIVAARICLFETYLAMEETDLALSQALEIMNFMGAYDLEIRNLREKEPLNALNRFLNWRSNFLQTFGYTSTYNQAVIDIYLGNYEAAIDKLKIIVSQRQFHSFFLIASDPRLAVLKDYPDANSIIKKTN